MLRDLKWLFVRTACIIFSATLLQAQETPRIVESIVTPTPLDKTSIESIEQSLSFEPKWVWSEDFFEEDVSIYIRQEFYLDGIPELATLEATVDNEYKIRINPDENPDPISADTDWKEPEITQGVEKYLHKGRNEIVIEAINRSGVGGAIALLRMVDRNGVTYVGTSENSEVSSDKNSWKKAHSLGDRFSKPWSLVEAESEKQKLARKESQRLVSEADLPSAEISAKAIVYQAYLSVEFFDTDFEEPIISLKVEKPRISILKKAIEILRANLYSSNAIRRSAALNAVSYILSSDDGFELLVKELREDFSVCGVYGETLQLVVLNQIKSLLDSDKQAVISANQAVDDKSKDQKNKHAEREAKEKNLSARRVEASHLNDQEILIQSKVKELNIEISTLNTERDLPATSSERRSQIDAELAKKVGEQNEADNEIQVIAQKSKAKYAEIATLSTELEILDQELTKLDGERTKLKEKFDGLSGVAIARLNATSTLLSDGNTNCSGLVRSLIQVDLDQIRKLRLSYAGSSALDDADDFFQKDPSTGTFSAPEPGARTSAADLPGVSERTVGERSGVSETAAFDPTLSNATRAHYPSTDDQGQRKQRDISKNPKLEPRKAPGATGAVFAK